jgi:hypothetical protein
MLIILKGTLIMSTTMITYTGTKELLLNSEIGSLKPHYILRYTALLKIFIHFSFSAETLRCHVTIKNVWRPRWNSVLFSLGSFDSIC